MAPEITKETGHSYPVDWWAVGILIYEMIIGITPFYNKSRMKLFQRIQTSQVKFPDREVYQIDYSDELVDLITKLTAKDAAKCLGTNGSAQEVISHPWFAEIDIAKLETGELTPPHNFANEDGSINKELYDVKTSKSAIELSEIPEDKKRAIEENAN